MAHIGVFQKGSTGFLNSTLELMSRLQSEGHQITCLSVWDCRQKVEALGFKYVPLPKVDFSYELGSADPKRRSFKYRLITLFKGRRLNYEEAKQVLKTDQFERILKDLDADMVLSTMELHEVILASKRLGIPFMIISDWFAFTRRKGLPPIRTSIIPGKAFSGSTIGITIAWFLTKGRIFARSVLNHLLLKSDRKTFLKKYAHEAGISSTELISRNFPSVFIYKNIPTLSMTLKELEFPHDFAPNIQYVGPMVSDTRPQEELSPEDNMRLKALFEQKAKTSDKIIYLSMSTIREVDSDFFKKVINAVKDQKDWVLIMTTAGNDPGHQFDELPDNVFYFKWLPHLTVLEMADCSINHGGINTINECIHFGVPMLIYSGQKYDQSGCAARVHHHKVGIMGNHSDSAAEIRSNLEKLLDGQDYLTAVERMQKIYFEQRKKTISPYLTLSE